MGSNLVKLLEDQKAKGASELDLAAQGLNELPGQIGLLRETLERSVLFSRFRPKF